MQLRLILGWAAAVALFGVAIAAVWSQRERLMVTTADLTKEVETAKQRLMVVTEQQKAAEASKTRFAAVIKLDAQLATIRSAPRWAPALRILNDSQMPGIELTEVDARESEDPPGTCALRITGRATGTEPRNSADRFRRALQLGFSKATNAETNVSFTALEDSPAATGESSLSSRFALSTTLQATAQISGTDLRGSAAVQP